MHHIITCFIFIVITVSSNWNIIILIHFVVTTFIHPTVLCWTLFWLFLAWLHLEWWFVFLSLVVTFTCHIKIHGVFISTYYCRSRNFFFLSYICDCDFQISSQYSLVCLILHSVSIWLSKSLFLSGRFHHFLFHTNKPLL